MDDTVREMRKKEGSGCNVERAGAVPACGWMRARGCTGSWGALAYVCGSMHLL